MTPDELRNAARALGLSGRGLAAVLGINERTYRRWLEGEQIPRVAVLAIQGLIAAKA